MVKKNHNSNLSHYKIFRKLMIIVLLLLPEAELCADFSWVVYKPFFIEINIC